MALSTPQRSLPRCHSLRKSLATSSACISTPAPPPGGERQDQLMHGCPALLNHHALPLWQALSLLLQSPPYPALRHRGLSQYLAFSLPPACCQCLLSSWLLRDGSGIYLYRGPTNPIRAYIHKVAFTLANEAAQHLTIPTLGIFHRGWLGRLLRGWCRWFILSLLALC